jgi:hypothetical protein
LEQTDYRESKTQVKIYSCILSYYVRPAYDPLNPAYLKGMVAFTSLTNCCGQFLHVGSCGSLACRYRCGPLCSNSRYPGMAPVSDSGSAPASVVTKQETDETRQGIPAAIFFEDVAAAVREHGAENLINQLSALAQKYR